MSSEISIQDLIQEASDKHFYYDVSSDKGMFSKKVVIGGAEFRWKTHAGYVYAPEFRISGNSADVKKVLSETFGWTKPYKTYKEGDQKTDGFKNELKEYEDYRDGEAEKNKMSDERYDEISRGFAHISKWKEEKTTVKKRFTAKDPKARYESLEKGKVLNVSKRQENGTGCFIQDAPDKTKESTSAIVGVPGIRIVSDSAKNLRDEMAAIGLWEEDEIEDAVQKWKKLHNAALSKSKKTVGLVGGKINPVK